MESRDTGMLCPVCRVDLVMADRQGVEIDYCPKCRGVWLDRGELDKIIERSPDYGPAAAAPYREPPRAAPGYHQHRDNDYDPRYRKKKKKSFLSDIFDFD